MSKLISQGGFGCVYHPGIKCDGTTDKKKFVSKLQINDYTAYNEIEIGKLIKSIPNFESSFLPIIEYCKVDVSEIDQHLIEKCNTLHNNTDLVLMKMNYVQNKSFYHFIDTNKSNIFSLLIDKYLYLLNSLEILNKHKIVHFDLKDENILLNSKNLNPIIIDYGISLNMNKFKIENVEDYFYVHAPEYYIWSFDIHIINFLSRKVDDDDFKIKKEHIIRIAEEYTSNHKILSLFSEKFIYFYKEQCVQFGFQFVNKSKTEVIKLLTNEKYYSTWDNFSLSCLILKSFKYIFDNKFINIHLFKEIVQLIIINIHPDPKKRYSVYKTKEKLNLIINNTQDSIENLFTFTNQISIKKDKIHVYIKDDNKTIQRIHKQNPKTKS